MSKLLLNKQNLVLHVFVIFFSLQIANAQVPDGGPQVPNDDQDKINLILKLSHQQPTAKAINDIIAMDSEGSDNPVRQLFSMTALTQLGPSKISDAYVFKVLDDDGSPPASMQGALGYLAVRSYSPVFDDLEKYADTYLATSNDFITRCMAARLAGSIRKSSSVETIKTLITDGDTSNSASPIYDDARLQAAYGLAHLLSVNDFIAFIDTTDLRGWHKVLAKQLNVFIQADDSIKRKMAGEYMSRSEFIFPLTAVKYMLEKPDFELLRSFVVGGNNKTLTIASPRMGLYIRVLGYELSGNINSITIKKEVFVPPPVDPPPVPDPA